MHKYIKWLWPLFRSSVLLSVSLLWSSSSAWHDDGDGGGCASDL